jgi:hypothetical protein
VFSARWSSSALWGRGKAGYRTPNARLLAPDPTPMDFFLWGHLKEYVYAVPPRTVEDLTARLQAAVTTVEANMLRCVRENAARRNAVYFETNGGRFEHLLLTTRHPRSDHLIAWAI